MSAESPKSDEIEEGEVGASTTSAGDDDGPRRRRKKRKKKASRRRRPTGDGDAAEERRRRSKERRKRKARAEEPAEEESAPEQDQEPDEAEEPDESEDAEQSDELEDAEDADWAIDPPAPEKNHEFRIGLGLATVAVSLFYYFTACRWIGLGDTAIVLDEMLELKVNSHVNNHTIAIIFGWLFSHLPVGELAFRVNLMSVFFGSIAVVLFFVIAHRTIQRLWASLGITAGVAVMHSMWWHSTIVENYAINAVALMGWLLCLLKDEEEVDSRYYYGACVIAGLAVVNHVQMGTLSVGVFVYAILQRNKEDYGLIVRWLKMAGFFLIGFLPYLLALVRDMMKSPDAMKVIYWATGGDFQSRMFDFEPAKVFKPLLIEFLIQFPSPMLIFAGLGIFYIGETSFYGKSNIALTIVFFINTLFFAQFHTWDKFAFLLPSFLCIAYWAAVGVRFLFEWMDDIESPFWRPSWAPKLAPLVYGLLLLAIGVPPYFYAKLPEWGLDEGFWHSRYNNNYTVNTHNCATYIANPNKAGWDEVDRFSHLLFDKLPERAVFMDDDSRVYYPLRNYFQKHYDLRPDVTVMLMNTWGFSGWGTSEDSFVIFVRRNIKRRRIFLVSIEHPFVGTVEKLGRIGIVPRRFDLGDHRWVYELVPEARLPRDLPLIVADMIPGRAFDAKIPVLKWHFGPHEAIGVQARFKRNDEPVTVKFRWQGPDGGEYFVSEPFTVAEGNDKVFSYLDDGGDRPKGAYTVTLIADDVEVSSTDLTVE